MLKKKSIKGLSLNPQMNIFLIPEIKTWEDLIGNTPLLKLERIFANQKMNLYAKLEQFNLGGSIKDRPALLMIKEAIREGKIKQGTTIIESSSGNTGIALAYVCLRHGLNFIAC